MHMSILTCSWTKDPSHCGICPLVGVGREFGEWALFSVLGQVGNDMIARESFVK